MKDLAKQVAIVIAGVLLAGYAARLIAKALALASPAAPAPAAG